MDNYTYTLKQDKANNEKLTYYRRDELELMTTFQLRDICWRERIINGMQAPLDKDELIRQALAPSGLYQRQRNPACDGHWKRGNPGRSGYFIRK